MKNTGIALIAVSIAAIAWIVFYRLFSDRKEGFEYGKPSEFTTEVKTPYPWFSRLRIADSKGEGTCGASLIAPSVMITAAHCVRPGSKITAFIGGVRFDGSDAEQREVVSSIIHPEYQKMVDEKSFYTLVDVAILNLDRPSTKTPIEMVGSIEDITSDDLAHVGYGRTDGTTILEEIFKAPTGKPPEFLQETPMYFGGWGHKKCVQNFKLFAYKNEKKREELEKEYTEYVAQCPSKLSPEECSKLPPFETLLKTIMERNEAVTKNTKELILDQDKNSFVCALGKKESLCMGDSGGPLFVKRSEKPLLVGITSTVPHGCNAETRSMKMPNWFASVFTNRNWILETAGIQPSGPSLSGPSSSGPSLSGPSLSGPSSSGPSTDFSTGPPPYYSPSSESSPSPAGSEFLGVKPWIWIVSGVSICLVIVAIGAVLLFASSGKS